MENKIVDVAGNAFRLDDVWHVSPVKCTYRKEGLSVLPWKKPNMVQQSFAFSIHLDRNHRHQGRMILIELATEEKAYQCREELIEKLSAAGGEIAV